MGRLFIFGLIAACVTGGSASCSARDTMPAVVVVNEKHNGARIAVSSGGILEVQLLSVPGTGYSWHAVRQDARYLKLIETKLLPHPRQAIAGAAETQLLRFEAVSSGESALELGYSRPWEKDVPPHKNYRITVEIR